MGILYRLILRVEIELNSIGLPNLWDNIDSYWCSQCMFQWGLSSPKYVSDKILIKTPSVFPEMRQCQIVENSPILIAMLKNPF